MGRRPPPCAPPSSTRRGRGPRRGPPPRASAGLKPKLDWIGLEGQQVADERVALEEARGLGDLGEPLQPRPPRLSPSFTAAASSRPRAPFASSSCRAASRSKAPSAATGSRSRWSRSVRARPRSDVRSPHPSPFQRDAAVEGVEQHVVPAHQAFAQPLLPRLREEGVRLRLVGHAEAGEDPALERPLLQDLGAQRVDGRNARALEHLEGGGHALRARRPASARRPAPARAARAGAASWWWPRSR